MQTNKLTKKNMQLAVKNEPLAFAIIGLIVVILIAASLSASREYESIENTPVVGREGQSLKDTPEARKCILDECLSVEGLDYPIAALPRNVESALKMAIDDEYKARATYDNVIRQYGSKRPFIMIIRSEEQHISVLLSLFDKYGVAVPENEWNTKTMTHQSFQEACLVAAQAEIDNTALYRNRLLPMVSEYEDVTRVFRNLMSASEDRHLPAFEQCSS